MNLKQNILQIAAAFQRRLVPAAKASPQNFFAPPFRNPLLGLRACFCTVLLCDQIANKSFSFVLLNGAENRFCDLQVFSNLSNSNYRIFVTKILLEIGFIEIGCISSNWPGTSHIICSILVQKR